MCDPTFRETWYRPGGSWIRYRPSVSVVTRPTTVPLREKSRVACFAGASHGCSAAQTGLIGPRVTMPRSPLGRVAAPAGATMRTKAMKAILRTPEG